MVKGVCMKNTIFLGFSTNSGGAACLSEIRKRFSVLIISQFLDFAALILQQ